MRKTNRIHCTIYLFIYPGSPHKFAFSKSQQKMLKPEGNSGLGNRPFAQLLPGLETGHPVTVGQSPTCSFSVSDGREVLFLSPFRAVLGAIHVQVIDRPSPDAPSLTQTNNCANGLFKLQKVRLLYQTPPSLGNNNYVAMIRNVSQVGLPVWLLPKVVVFLLKLVSIFSHNAVQGKRQ